MTESGYKQGFEYKLNKYGEYVKSQAFGKYYNVRLDVDPPEMYVKGRDWNIYKMLDRFTELIDSGKRPTMVQCEALSMKYKSLQENDLTHE